MIRDWLKLFWAPEAPDPLVECIEPGCGQAIRRSAMALHWHNAHRPRPSRVYELLEKYEAERGMREEPPARPSVFPN